MASPVNKDVMNESTSDGHKTEQPQEATDDCNPPQNPGVPHHSNVSVPNATNSPIILGASTGNTYIFYGTGGEKKPVPLKDGEVKPMSYKELTTMMPNKPELKSLQCSICKELFNEPKILDCLHTFCEKCLQDYCDRSHAGLQTIPCPLCRKMVNLPEEGAKGLQTNFHLVSVIMEEENRAMASVGTTETVCEMCTEGKTAMHRCLECVQNICPSCQERHKLITACSRHTIASLEDIQLGKVTLEKAERTCRCPKHEGEKLQFYCTPCEQLICRDCTVVNHSQTQGHYCISDEKAILQCKESLNNKFLLLRVKINEHREALARVAKAKEELNNNKTRAIKEVQDTAAEIIAKVKAEEIIAKVKADEKQLIDEINTVEQDHRRAFEEHEEMVNKILQTEQHSLEIAQDVINNASASDLLSLYRIISKNMTSLTQNTNFFNVDRRLSHLNFIQKHHLVVDNIVGELEIMDKRKWELDFEIDYHHKSGICDATNVLFLSTGDIAVTEWMKVKILSSTGNLKKTFNLTEPLHQVATINNQIVVTDGSENVKVYNEDGELAFQFHTRGGETTPRDIIISSFCLAVKKNIIIVGHTSRNVLPGHNPDFRNVLTEHSPEDGSLIHTIPVKKRFHFLAVDSNDRVMIIDGMGTVDVINDNGDTLLTIKASKSAHFTYRPKVCCDGTYIYIALFADDSLTGQIHCYDGEGYFLSCIVEDLGQTKAITVSKDGHMAVLDSDKVIKIYRKV